jgi:hypothetical protein
MIIQKEIWHTKLEFHMYDISYNIHKHLFLHWEVTYSLSALWIEGNTGRNPIYP